MATFLQTSASRKASTTTTVTGAIPTAGAKVLNAVHTSSGVGVAATHASHKKGSEFVASTLVKENTTDLSIKLKPTEYDTIPSTYVHESSSTADLSVKIKPTSYDSTLVPTGCEPTPTTCVHESPCSPNYSIKSKFTGCDTICITEEQKRIIYQGTSCLGDALSQVPWMKFRLIAEPNMDIFASDIRLRTFIREVTELTVSIVTKQCTEEIAVLVAVLIANLTSSMEVRIKLIVETIIEQIASLCLADTMTECQNLDEIKEKVCFPKHHEHRKYGSHDSYGDSDKHHHHHDPYGNKPTYGDKPHDSYTDQPRDTYIEQPHDTYTDKPHDTDSDSDKRKKDSDKSKHPSYSESPSYKPGPQAATKS